ncbi:phenylalanyl-tRNA synthetase subunit beta [Methanomassiliicoccales archaeon RumEn M1]|nr:phenylalanyl-tRNA synthetase subunit beta [Methanomassiliicoccales archaeon RumEn M1]
MPVVTFDYDDLVGLIGREVPMETLLERVPQLGADIHSCDPATGELSIEFFPDRSDLYSVEGAARALRSFLGFEKGLTRYEVEASDVVLNIDPSVKDVRPYMVAGVVEDIVMSDDLIRSMMELQEKLHLTMGRKRAKVSIGLHDMARIKAPFTFKAVDPRSVSFVPLAKDEEMDLQEILEKHEKGRDYAYILQGKDRYPLLVDSEGNVLSFPPIINGTLTTVTEETTRVFIDVTGTDLDAITGALNIVATAMAERGGKVRSVTVTGLHDLVTPDLAPRKWSISIDEANKLLGTSLDGPKIAVALEKMGYEAKVEGRQIHVLAPATRLDLIHPVDVMEDIAKGIGYESFGTTLPTEVTFGELGARQKASDAARQLMVGYGYLEVTTLMLSSPEEQFEKMHLEPVETVDILNPISEDHTCLRVSLVPSILAVMRRNKHRDLPQRLFEVGDVMVGCKRAKHIAAAAITSRASFTEVKSLVEGIMRDLSVRYEIAPSSLGCFIDGRGAEVLVDGRNIGSFGELHPAVITAFELGHPITVFEMDLDALTEGKLERIA